MAWRSCCGPAMRPRQHSSANRGRTADFSPARHSQAALRLPLRRTRRFRVQRWSYSRCRPGRCERTARAVGGHVAGDAVVVSATKGLELASWQANEPGPGSGAAAGAERQSMRTLRPEPCCRDCPGQTVLDRRGVLAATRRRALRRRCSRRPPSASIRTGT